LSCLDISQSSLTDEGLLAISACPQLAFLNVQGTNVSAAGVASLRRLLPDCEITSDYTTDQVLKASAELPPLIAPAAPRKTETERVGQIDQTFANWLLTSNPGGESRVMLLAPDNVGGQLSSASQLPSDGRYRVAGAYWRDETPSSELHRLAQLRWLNKLWLARNNWSQDAVDALIPLRQLCVLNLTGKGLHGMNLARLADLHGLEELVVSDPTVTASDLAWVSQLPHLSRLSIPTKALSPDAGFDLRRLPQLRQLGRRPNE
jgi:hypothetical protein